MNSKTAVADGGYFSNYEIKKAKLLGINSLINPGKIAETKLKPFREAMAAQLELPHNKKLLKARSSVNEGTFGQIKANMNYTKILDVDLIWSIPKFKSLVLPKTSTDYLS